MRWFSADFHIHSVLSPCGGLEMSPKSVINRIKELNIEWISITDHNSMANCPAYELVALKNGIFFTWGVEIQTNEEIHLLAYFDDACKAKEFDRELYQSLLPMLNDADFFGDQVVVDESDNIIRIEERALANSSSWSLETAINRIRDYGGVYVPAHVDASANSIISQLGFIPDNIEFPLLGITAKLNLDLFLSENPDLSRKSFLRCSDAHYLSDLGSGITNLFLEQPTFSEVMLATLPLGNRCISV